MTRTPPQQILKANAEIMIEFSQIGFHKDKKQVYSLNSNSNHNWINNADAPSLDRPYIPLKAFFKAMLTLSDNSVSTLPTRTILKYV